MTKIYGVSHAERVRRTTVPSRMTILVFSTSCMSNYVRNLTKSFANPSQVLAASLNIASSGVRGT